MNRMLIYLCMCCFCPSPATGCMIDQCNILKLLENGSALCCASSNSVLKIIINAVAWTQGPQMCQVHKFRRSL